MNIQKTLPENFLKSINSIAFMIFIFTLIFSACKKENHETTKFEQLVGTEGATVVDLKGTTIVIPAGALTTPTKISITTFADGKTLNKDLGVSPFSGGAKFEPEGLTFLKPVTITLPVEKTLEAGGKYAIFLYDKDPGITAKSSAPRKGDYDSKAWGKIKTDGVASSDGKSVTFSTNHFSTYVSSDFSAGCLQVFGEELENTGDPEIAFSTLKEEYLPFIGKTAKTGDKCYKIVAIYFDAMGVYNNNDFQEIELQPEGIDPDFKWDKVTTLSYAYDHSSSDCDSTGECTDAQLLYQVIVNIYWEETECLTTYHITFDAEFPPTKDTPMIGFDDMCTLDFDYILLHTEFDIPMYKEYENNENYGYFFGSSDTDEKPPITVTVSQMYGDFSVKPGNDACYAIITDFSAPSTYNLNIEGSVLYTAPYRKTPSFTFYFDYFNSNKDFSFTIEYQQRNYLGTCISVFYSYLNLFALDFPGNSRDYALIDGAVYNDSIDFEYSAPFKLNTKGTCTIKVAKQ